MNVREIVKKYLEKNGYIGLYYPGECGCLIDDLIPCGHLSVYCKPGYKNKCDCGDGCDFHIGPTKGE